VATLERANYKVTFSVLVLGVMAYALLQSLVIPALTTIQTVMHTSQNTVTWVVTAYLLAASIFTPILGRIGDVVGKERMMVVALLSLAVGSIVAALAHTIAVLIIGRAIQGVGGGVLPLAFGIIRDEFPREKLAGAIGIMAALVAVGGGAGLVVAGPILNGLGFHWLFWIPLIMTATAAAATHFLVPESPVRIPGGISVWGALTLSAWLVALLLGVSEGPVWGWHSTRVLGLLAAAVVMIVVWVIVELHVTDPVVDMKMMRVTAVWTNNLVSFLFGMGMYSVMAFLPEFLQTPRHLTGYGLSATSNTSGLYLVPLTACMFFVGLFTGKIADRFGSKAAVILGSAISTSGYLMLTFAHNTTLEVCAASALLGIGLGFAFSAMSNLIVQAVPPSQTGIASGMNANIRTIGGAVGAGIASSVVTSHVLSSGYPAESGYSHGFFFMALCSLLAVVAALLIPTASRVQGDHHQHAEMAIVPGGTITEG